MHQARRAHQFRACASMHTTDTRARMWDADVPGSYEQVLDDEALRYRLKGLNSFWERKSDIAPAQASKFVLLAVPLDLTSPQHPLQIQQNTLRDVLRFAGLGDDATDKIINNTLCSAYCNFQYQEDDDIPTSLSVARVQFRTRDCFVWLSCCMPQDMDELMSRVMANRALLKIHPLYFLSILFDHRFLRWTDRLAELWQDVSAIETSTDMIHDRWKLMGIDENRAGTLSNVDKLLRSLYTTHTELRYSHVVTASAMRLGQEILKAIAAIESGRRDLGCKPLSKRERNALEERVNTTLVRCDSMDKTMKQMTERLSVQINMSFILIAQRDSKINFAIAKLQAHDSRTVKGIAVLTLSFLPATLVATIWTTNLFSISGERNWQIFIGVVASLTAVVFACWWTFGQISERRDDRHWPANSNLDSSTQPLDRPNYHGKMG
ncbi:hypothetical protein HJFPF1_06981 [Paramyrothecium foliicola]|nr:hypothetical protein HJFPF1_06981 [Paramyrothecium foliicola]